MAHNLRPDLFILIICSIFQSLCSSCALASLANSPLLSSFHSLMSASAASTAQKLQSHPCYPPDRDALLDAAASRGLPMPGWSQEQDCCLWEGVTCGSGPPNSSTMSSSINSSAVNPKLYSRVVELELQRIMAPSPGIPLAICRLSALIFLDLSLNYLIGPIPTCFGHNLTSLRTLDLSYNSLSGSLSPLANLSLLQTLILSYNSLSGSLSPLANLSLLTHLDVFDIFQFGDNSLPRTLSPLANLSLLQTLILYDDSLSGSLSPLANLSLLTHLQLESFYMQFGDNSLPGSLSPLANLSLLQTLILYDFSGSFSGSLSPLANLSLLQTLNLNENSFSGSLSPLAKLSLLTNLYLSYNQFSDSSLSPLANLSLLQTLILSGNSLSGSLSPLVNLSLLTYLDLSHNQFTSMASPDLNGNALSPSSESFTKLALHWTHLQYLDLSFNLLKISLNYTPAAFSITPLLQYLALGGIEDKITGDIRVLQHLQHLETLELREMSVPAPNLGSLFCKLKSLQSLLIYASPSGDDIHAASTPSAPLDGMLLCEKPVSVNLSSLELSGQGYTGPFPTWIAHFTRLQYLILEGNQFGGSIPQGWQALTQLTHLSISNHSPMTPVSFSQEDQISSLFRLPLVELTLGSMGLTSLGFPCAEGFSLLNQTLQYLDLSHNHISLGHNSLLHCLKHHEFSQILSLHLSKNPLALPLEPHMFPVSIQSLDLSYCQLFGSIPSDIGSTLTAINHLDLSSNKLTGIIPSSIWNLTTTGYSWLRLSNNYLNGELALRDHVLTAGEVSIANNFLSKAYFYNVSYVGILDLSSNRLSGTLEGLLGDYSMMKNLTILLLHNNELKGSIPTSLGTSAPFLITLDLSNNMLSGAIPPNLQHLLALQSKILETFFNASIASSYTLKSVKNVELNMSSDHSRGYLDLSSNQLTGFIPDGLGALVRLHDLNLSRNQLSGSIPPSLAHLASLESLDLSFNNLEGAIPSEFSKLASLEVFNVSFNPKLKGKIPEGPQLDTDTSYKGDYQLCGQAINKSCGEQQLIGASTPIGQELNTLQTVGFKERFASFIKGIEKWATIPGIILGHVLGTTIIIWALKRIHFYE